MVAISRTRLKILKLRITAKKISSHEMEMWIVNAGGRITKAYENKKKFSELIRRRKQAFFKDKISENKNKTKQYASIAYPGEERSDL